MFCVWVHRYIHNTISVYVCMPTLHTYKHSVYTVELCMHARNMYTVNIHKTQPTHLFSMLLVSMRAFSVHSNTTQWKTNAQTLPTLLVCGWNQGIPSIHPTPPAMAYVWCVIMGEVCVCIVCVGYVDMCTGYMGGPLCVLYCFS